MLRNAFVQKISFFSNQTMEKKLPRNKNKLHSQTESASTIESGTLAACSFSTQRAAQCQTAASLADGTTQVEPVIRAEREVQVRSSLECLESIESRLIADLANARYASRNE